MTMQGPGSHTVMADAQFTNAFIMLPYKNFEDTYQGIPATTPLYLTEGGDARDSLAGQPGYDPELQKGLAVPLGSRVLLWLPELVYIATASPLVINGYQYSFTWRLRNVFDYRQDRRHYHFPKQVPGVADATVSPAADRVVIPAANNSVVYVQPEPGAFLERAVQNARSEDIRVLGSNLPLAVAPGGVPATNDMTVQQGIQDPAVTTTARTPGFLVHELQAVGDELLVAIRRVPSDDGSPANWDFTDAGGTDEQVSDFYGKGRGTPVPDRGVYAFTGTSP